MTCTPQGVGIDQYRDVGLLVAVLAAVQVEHELRQRTVQARELAAAGYTRESLARYIGDYNRFPWDELSSELQESLLEVAKKGEIPGLSVEDCRPGGTVPVFDSSRLGILVSGPLNGQTIGMTYSGASGLMQGAAAKPRKTPFYLKKITGVALTKAGR